MKAFAIFFAGSFASVIFMQVPAAGAATETVVYSFCSQANCTDGAYSTSGLTAVNGKLFGTTQFGGANSCQYSPEGCGTVFMFDPSTGKETVSYSFQSGADGNDPQARPIEVRGMLYGTTTGGGTSGYGTVYSLDPGTGAEKVLYSFCSLQNCGDGEIPLAKLSNLKDTLYGTTQLGGKPNRFCASGCGTVYSLNAATGAEMVLYSFCRHGGSGCTDGRYPSAGVTGVSGTLYGVTNYGDAGNGGVLFAVDPTTGKEKTLYSFCSQQNCTDGAEPMAELLDVNGTLYGTTIFGGTGTNCGPGCGTVFSFDPGTGKERVLHSFCSQRKCADGVQPEGELLDVNGTLYGVAANGGTYGLGVVFAINPDSGKEKVLYSFCSQQNCADGSFPVGHLVDVSGVLYGITTGGGANSSQCTAFTDSGCGVIFAIMP